LICENVIDFAKSIDGLENGEGLFTDEAEVFKRVLQIRIAEYIKPKSVIETHAGKGIGTYIYKNNGHCNNIFSCHSNFEKELLDCQITGELIDVDPYGFCYNALEKTRMFWQEDSILTVSSGEIMSIVRGLKNDVLKTKYKGREFIKWIPDYVMHIESLTKMKCVFYYAFPSTIRLFLTNRLLPKDIFYDIPSLMWWLKKYK
jgi:hypothetical protein